VLPLRENFPVSTSDESLPKIAMIGIDGGDLKFIREFLGHLPNFRWLIEAGQCRGLETTADILPGSVWPTFYTGALPGEHGVYHHLQWDAESMRMRRVSEDWLYCEPFWYELSRCGQRICVVDVPMTFPTRLHGGLEVINWGSHDQLGEFHCNDVQLAQDIMRRFGPHPMGAEIPVDKTPTQLNRIRQNLTAGAERKGELIRWLMNEGSWDFFLTVFGECHRGGHILWPEEELDQSSVPDKALLAVYAAVDAALGDILRSLDLERTLVVIFSVHGMQRNMSQEHFVPLLMDHFNAQFSGSSDHARRSRSQRSPMRLLREMVPARLQHAIAHLAPVSVRDWVVSRATDGGYDWSTTPAIPLLADMNGYIRLNLQGRESNGSLVLDGASVRRYVDWLEESFMQLRIASSGEPLVESVVEIGRRFGGHRADRLPDLVVTWPNTLPVTDVYSERVGNVEARLITGRSGNHRPEGFLAVVGKNRAETAIDRVRHIADFRSLVLNQFNISTI
jgi:predicted AlkP superfamily phosphohydrolase/phosphomutase